MDLGQDKMKRWYVVQVYAGFEETIKADLERQIKDDGLEQYIGEVLVPSAKMKKQFGSDEPEEEQLFPGYVLVEAEIVPESFRLITSHPRVLRFLGGKEPIPLRKKEIERVLSQIRGEVVVASEQVEFIIGSEVEIKDGPFAGFVGIIDKVDSENEKLTVMVSIFGRMTPVELTFSQVKQ